MMNLKSIEIYNDSALRILCEPLFDSYALKRLESISFLGILSPEYDYLTSSPLYRLSNSRKKIFSDGTRKEHSIGVALIILHLAKRLNLSETAQKYAVSWGLLHDIATWSLSHTGEVAFSAITNTSSRKLREMIIGGSKQLPSKLTVNKQIREIGIDPKVLLSLFDKKNAIRNKELNILWKIIHSPITPDTLEGMWRTGKVFNINFPSLWDYQNKINQNLFDSYISKENSIVFLDFWRKKSRIYNNFINQKEIIFWESAWSNSIKIYFNSLKLIDSLEISESEIVESVLNKGIINERIVLKYKNPQKYYIKDNRRKLDNINIYQLNEFLLKDEKSF